ncbi:hypothetical protein HK097_011358 [Rhizophlyctis rosea]|uniref:Uncharacterized protein n=1 Tax=Rhizophlyctis rosea TaxID=64517 RepID=A0AAD5X2I7_9FUNG|nr:hypothetical protein HK097_011358 [Rhizophlyctis rosea]
MVQQQIDAIEAGLMAKMQVLEVIKGAFTECYMNARGAMCAMAFPKCNEMAAPTFACQSVCTAFQASCAVPFTLFNRTADLPQHCLSIPPPINASFTPAPSCTYFNNSALMPAQESLTCPSPLIRYTDPHTPQTKCVGACCLPCPHHFVFYPEKVFYIEEHVLTAVRAVSCILAAYIFLAYIMQPGKKQWTLLHVIGCVALWQSATFFQIGQPSRTQCVDAVTSSTMENNPLCAVQGGLIIFAAMGAAMWTAYLIINLHLHIVWKSDVLERHGVWIGVLLWCVPIGFTVYVLYMRKVAYTFGLDCLVTADFADKFFFYPLSIMVYPAFLLHIITFIIFARVVLKARFDDSHIKSNTSGSLVGSGKTVSAYRRLMVVLKSQWRAFVTALIFLVIFTMFWMIHFFSTRKATSLLEASGADPSTFPKWLLEWGQCIFLPGGSQEACRSIVPPEAIPQLIPSIVSDTLICIVGIFIFPVFGTRPEVLTWWRRRKESQKGRVFDRASEDGQRRTGPGGESYSMRDTYGRERGHKRMGSEKSEGGYGRYDGAYDTDYPPKSPLPQHNMGRYNGGDNRYPPTPGGSTADLLPKSAAGGYGSPRDYNNSPRDYRDDRGDYFGNVDNYKVSRAPSVKSERFGAPPPVYASDYGGPLPVSPRSPGPNYTSQQQQRPSGHQRSPSSHSTRSNMTQRTYRDEFDTSAMPPMPARHERNDYNNTNSPGQYRSPSRGAPSPAPSNRSYASSHAHRGDERDWERDAPPLPTAMGRAYGDGGAGAGTPQIVGGRGPRDDEYGGRVSEDRYGGRSGGGGGQYGYGRR